MHRWGFPRPGESPKGAIIYLDARPVRELLTAAGNAEAERSSRRIAVVLERARCRWEEEAGLPL